MALVACGGCKRTVLARSDGTCPSCGAATAGAAAVRLTPMAADEAQAWRRHEDERRERRALGQQLRERGNTLTASGFVMATLGLIVSVGTFVAAAGGGMYVVCSGAIVGGVAMAVRGRDLIARARTLDTD